MQPFYFKSYQKVVGVAHDLSELKEHLKEIGTRDPACVNYHLSEGHIVSWLQYIGEDSAAEALIGVKDFNDALKKLEGLESNHHGTSMMNEGMMQRRREMMMRMKGKPAGGP
ncbi:MAG: hypothetical protein ACP5T5_04355 [Thermoprotei archaeon]|nr:hypothetical protein [TACK group archaeon]